MCVILSRIVSFPLPHRYTFIYARTRICVCVVVGANLPKGRRAEENYTTREKRHAHLHTHNKHILRVLIVANNSDEYIGGETR